MKKTWWFLWRLNQIWSIPADESHIPPNAGINAGKTENGEEYAAGFEVVYLYFMAAWPDESLIYPVGEVT